MFAWILTVLPLSQAYCDPGLVSEVIVPLLSMQSSVLLCISTLLDGGNHYSKMINLKDPSGNPVFESVAITLVCDECMKSEHPEKYVLTLFKHTQLFLDLLQRS